MAFPNVIYGDFGDEKVTSSTKIGNLPLGAKMILPDGREFVHAKANTAAALSIAAPIVQKAVAGTSVNVAVAADVAIGGTTISLTMPATTLCTVADQYAGGFLSVNDATGEGYTYKIKKSNTAAAASACTFVFEDTDGIKVALVAGTSEVTIRENPFYDVLDRAAGTGSVGVPAGVAAVSVTAGYYCWLQRKGTASLMAAGTVSVRGRGFACATTVSGFQAHNPTPADTTTAPVAESWGFTEVAAAASTEYFVGYLTLS
jgi:hypothetical protein